MSLYLPEQKLGTHSQPDSTSHKFMLKGRQTGTMHRGHSWVFRAESHETMMAWYEDIESLISKTGEARNAFVRRHVRTVSGNSYRTSIDGVMDEDEADRTPYSPESAVLNQERPASQPREPGGRFPSDVQIDRHLQAPLSPSSGESSGERDLLAAAGSLPDHFDPNAQPMSNRALDENQPRSMPAGASRGHPFERHDSYYGAWMSPTDPSARQKQQEAQQTYSASENQGGSRFYGGDNSSQSHTLFVAGMGSGSSRDSSVVRQRNRGESASTAPTTTNVTDHTHNTVPTSIDEGPEPSITGSEKPSHDTQEKTLGPAAEVTSAKTVPVMSSGGITPNGVTTEGTKRPSAQSKNSVSTLELRIPGHYPPANVSSA
ncbi:uncharacterized protein LDX57_012628 [Aspergillus melleus]|uniref:uncharacterized protein n=1 Tax=Aspergillus melleus TaxID=138277 RepID=UPI001E8D97D2|nr:uncharacterized protein LDX57_012628 [Aspergillus melleus]KAH8434999.1 hypothetical protein LDX57_012628 [Aspergillus melleus]